jgi:DNA repair exonuclease SbcCD ATPase subunit
MATSEDVQARLSDEIAALSSQVEGQKAEIESQKAEIESQKAENEKLRAEAAEVEKLRAEIAELRAKSAAVAERTPHTKKEEAKLPPGLDTFVTLQKLENIMPFKETLKNLEAAFMLTPSAKETEALKAELNKLVPVMREAIALSLKQANRMRECDTAMSAGAETFTDVYVRCCKRSPSLLAASH